MEDLDSHAVIEITIHARKRCRERWPEYAEATSTTVNVLLAHAVNTRGQAKKREFGGDGQIYCHYNSTLASNLQPKGYPCVLIIAFSSSDKGSLVSLFPVSPKVGWRSRHGSKKRWTKHRAKALAKRSLHKTIPGALPPSEPTEQGPPND